MTDSDHTPLLRALLTAVMDLDELPHSRHAGRMFGQAIPQVSAEVDDLHLEAVVGSFRDALYEAREKGRAVN